MTDENRDDAERAERDERRSDEARWQVAEAGAYVAAEDEEDLASGGRPVDPEDTTWENEGGK